MKALRIIVGVLVLAIFGFSLLLLYSQYQYLSMASRAPLGYRPSLTNEFYLVLISTLVLCVFSIPTLIYQVKQIFRSQPIQRTDDLIDDTELLLKPKRPVKVSKFLHGSTKFYAFALLTEVILLGKRSSGVLSKMATATHWYLLIGFALSAFVAIYFLTVDKKS